MAVDLALSIRSFDDRPVTLVCDDENACLARRDFPNVFAAYYELPADYLRFHWGPKFALAEASNFDETVYLDADCLILSSPDTLWTHASARPVSLTGEILPHGVERRHGGFPVTKLMERFGILQYIKNNGGVIHFRGDEARLWFQECFACYEHEIIPALWDGVRPVHTILDEIAFAVTGARRGFGVYMSPVPQFWDHEIESIDCSAPSKPVLHITGPVPSSVLEPLLVLVQRRRQEAGLPPSSSLALWRRKSARPSSWKVIKRHVFHMAQRFGLVDGPTAHR